MSSTLTTFDRSKAEQKILDEIEVVREQCQSLTACLFKLSDYSKPLDYTEGSQVKESVFDFVLGIQQLAHRLEVCTFTA